MFFCSIHFCPSLATLAPVFFWKDYFFIYNHRLLFVIGLVFSRSLTNVSIVSVIAWYFTVSGDDVLKSAILTNAHGFLSSVFVIFMAYVADSFVGRLKTLLCSNVAYVIVSIDDQQNLQLTPKNQKTNGITNTYSPMNEIRH
ncbi:hypothetical protein Hanom_Chr15g01340191 [Helianthus anomalus]